jgi:thiamine biosynthesis protein ThiS
MKPEFATIFANGNSEQVRLPCSVSDFVTDHGWKTTQVVVEFNGRVLQRDELGETMLHGGEQLEVIVPVAGG